MTVDLHIKGMSMSEKTAVTYPELNTPAGNAPAAQDAGTQIKQLRFFVVTPAKLGEAFLYRWKLAVFVGLCFACVGAAIAWVTYKPKYTASAHVRLTSNKKNVLPGAEEAGRQSRDEDFQKTQAFEVKYQRQLLRKVLESDGIRELSTVRMQEDALVWLEKELQASFVSGTEFIRVSLSGEHPEDLKEIVNRVFDAYQVRFAEISTKERDDRLLNIERATISTEAKVQEKRTDLKNLTEKLGTNDPQALTLRQRIIIEEFGVLKREQSALEAEMRKLQSAQQVHKEELDKIDKNSAPEVLVKDQMELHPTVQKAQHEVDRIEAKLKENRRLYKADSPRLKEVENELKTAQTQLEKSREAVRPDVLAKVQDLLRRQHATALSQAVEKHRIIEKQHAAVKTQVQQAQESADAIGKGSLGIENQRGQLAELELVLKRLRAEKERLQIEKMSSTDLREALRISTQWADTPTVNQASLVKTGGIYALIGLALGLFGISYLEARFHRVHKTTSLHQELGVPTLGVLPLLAKRRAGAYGGPGEGMPGILFTDAVNGICTRLLCDDRLSKNSVLMVTSANEDEGKTTVATQLAMGMARAGRKTLLLDCDFRNPSCEKHLALESSLGIAEVLCGEVELGEALQSIPNSDMKVLAAGEFNSQVTKALNDGRLAALLKRLRKEFDCIIIDSAPTPVVADGLLIGKLVDGVIVVIRAKVSKTPSVVSAIDQLSVLKIPALGSVINANPSGVTSYYL